MTAVQVSSLPSDILAALRAAFWQAAIDELALLSGGLSGATLLSFTVAGTSYVLRKGDVARAPQSLACLRHAAERGVAPELRYADDRTGICIMDRVRGQPFGRDPMLAPNRVERVATALRRLHEGPAFPPAPTLAQTLEFFQAQKIAPTVARVLQDIAPSTERFAAAAPCHRDLNPNNILETSERDYFVDWEGAGQGDPFLDLAQLGVFAFPAPERREVLLASYLGRPPTDEEKARTIVARVRALAVYALAFVHVQSLTGTLQAAGEAVPLADLLRELAAQRERIPPGTLAASLQREMQREMAATALRDAVAQLRAD
jgi:aminoglycoside phosphotransferase (APT) family kinase protein